MCMQSAHIEKKLKMQRFLVIIPAYNEAENIEKVINELEAKAPFYDYIIINDCSKDNTAQVLKKRKGKVISLAVNLGVGGAVQTGYIYALENDYDIAVQLDGDGQHAPSYLKELVKPVESGEANICIGSRFIQKKGFQSSGLRKLGISFLSCVIYLCIGKKIKDVTSGFRAVDKKYIEFFANDYPQDYPEPEAIVTAYRNGAVIKEIPVVMREREKGTSSIDLKRGIYYMIKVTLSIVLANVAAKRGRRKRDYL